MKYINHWMIGNLGLYIFLFGLNEMKSQRLTSTKPILINEYCDPLGDYSIRGCLNEIYRLIETHKDTSPISFTRYFVGQEVSVALNSELESPMTHVVWRSKPVISERFEDKIVQVAPNILVYYESPDSIKNVLFSSSQPTMIEFLDSSLRQTLRTFDIMGNLPFKRPYNAKLTYFNFDAERMNLLPFAKQQNTFIPDEYSIFTNVEALGNHIILSYKQVILHNFTIVDMNTSLVIFNYYGEVIAELNNIPTWDKGVISPSGNFMLYIFGGNIATVNEPFAKLQEPGWALMDLRSKSVVYSELELDGTHLDGVFLIQGLLEVNSTTPYDKFYYDYKVFFDDSSRTLYKKYWFQSEWNNLLQEVKETNNKDWLYYISKYKFETVTLK